MEFGQFIQAHETDDVGALALARGKYAGEPFDFDLALTTLEVRRKLRDKVPEWYAVPSLRYPFRVSGEQCSSSETARYKASVALQASEGGSVADLTGGLGVDSWAFAQVFGQVLYNEMRPELAAAAEANFKELGVSNIQVRNQELRPGHLADVLDGFQPGILYLDPARRSEDGRKVFRLEDCQPDVLQLLTELLSACPLVLLKLSPMADITLVSKQLAFVREVHVVAAEGECKELLLLLESGYEGPYSLFVYENGSRLEILRSVQNEDSHPEKPGDEVFSGAMKAGNSLYEPGKGLLKAGVFELPCRYGLEKLGRHTHLYVGEEIPEALKPFGKVFRIVEVAPLDKRNLKRIGQTYPQAEVTARNIPLTSDELRARLHVRSGGPYHIFGLHVDALQDHFLLVCTRI